MSEAILYKVTCISKENPKITDKILFTNDEELLKHLETNGVGFNHLVELVYSAGESPTEEVK
jgi:hypothetical protein